MIMWISILTMMILMLTMTMMILMTILQDLVAVEYGGWKTTSTIRYHRHICCHFTTLLPFLPCYCHFYYCIAIFAIFVAIFATVL